MGCLKSKLVSRVANDGRGGETGGGEQRRAGRQAGAVMSMLPSVIQPAQTVVPNGRSYHSAVRRASFNSRSLVFLCVWVLLGVYNCRIFPSENLGTSVYQRTTAAALRALRFVIVHRVHSEQQDPRVWVSEAPVACWTVYREVLSPTRIRSSFWEGLFLRSSRTEVDITPAVREGACGSA